MLVQTNRCYAYQLMADKCNVARFNDDYVKAFRRLCVTAVMSMALEEVEAARIRPGGKLEFMLERIGAGIGPSCYALNISCIMNGSV